MQARRVAAPRLSTLLAALALLALPREVADDPVLINDSAQTSAETSNGDITTIKTMVSQHHLVLGLEFKTMIASRPEAINGSDPKMIAQFLAEKNITVDQLQKIYDYFSPLRSEDFPLRIRLDYSPKSSGATAHLEAINGKLKYDSVSLQLRSQYTLSPKEWPLVLNHEAGHVINHIYLLQDLPSDQKSRLQTLLDDKKKLDAARDFCMRAFVILFLGSIAPQHDTPTDIGIIFQVINELRAELISGLTLTAEEKVKSVQIHYDAAVSMLSESDQDDQLIRKNYAHTIVCVESARIWAEGYDGAEFLRLLEKNQDISGFIKRYKELKRSSLPENASVKQYYGLIAAARIGTADLVDPKRNTRQRQLGQQVRDSAKH